MKKKLLKYYLLTMFACGIATVRAQSLQNTTPCNTIVRGSDFNLSTGQIIGKYDKKEGISACYDSTGRLQSIYAASKKMTYKISSHENYRMFTSSIVGKGIKDKYDTLVVMDTAILYISRDIADNQSLPILIYWLRIDTATNIAILRYGSAPGNLLVRDCMEATVSGKPVSIFMTHDDNETIPLQFQKTPDGYYFDNRSVFGHLLSAFNFIILADHKLKSPDK